MSKDQNGRQVSVQQQEKENGNWLAAVHPEWNLIAVCVDNDRSASRYAKKPRPQYQRALQMLRDGNADTILVWNIDRLLRRSRDLEVLIELVDKNPGILVASTNGGGETDLNDKHGRLTARIEASVAENYSDGLSEGVLRGKRGSAAAGGPTGGPRWFGFRNEKLPNGEVEVHVVAEEARLIRDAAERVLAGTTLNEIAREWTANGVVGSKGNTNWSGTVIRTILVAPRLCGLRVHQGQVIGKGAWDPIIDRRTHDRLVRFFGDPSRRASSPPRKTLFTALLECAKCGTTLVLDNDPTGSAVYRCRKSMAHARWAACGSVTVRREPVDRLLLDAMFDRMAKVSLMKRRKLQGTDRDWETERDDIEAQMEELAQMSARREITTKEWMAARSELAVQLESVNVQLRRRDIGSVFAEVGSESVAEKWDTFDFDTQRRYVKAMFGRVPIGPATQRGFTKDPAERLRRIKNRINFDSDGFWNALH